MRTKVRVRDQGSGIRDTKRDASACFIISAAVLVADFGMKGGGTLVPAPRSLRGIG